MLLRYDNFFYADSPWLLYKRCCAKTFFRLCCTMTFFHAAAPCIFFPHCCTMATFSALLCHIYSFHHAAPCLLFPRCCAISSLSTSVLCLLFPRCCAMSRPTFSTRLLRYDLLFHDWQNYVLIRTVDIKSFLANYYRVRWASQFPMIGLACFFLFRSFTIPVSKEWNPDQTPSSPASDRTLHCSVMYLNMTLYVICGAIEMGTGSSKLA